jgi:molecular chaperone Hsp33
MGLPYQEIPHNHQVEYFCACTQERVKQALGVLGKADLDEMIQEREITEITCQMCGRRYQISVEELIELRDLFLRNSMH